MRLFLDWLQSRWRTRGEYGMRVRGFARRWLIPLGVRLAGSLAVIAIFVAGLFWVLGGPSRSGARALRIEALRDSVVRAVASGRAGAAASVDDLAAAGVLGTDDVRFLADQGVAYQPITRSSPDTAIVFVRTAGGVERRYRKDGTEDHYTSSTSRDGRMAAVVGPGRLRAGAPARQMRSVTVRSLETGRVIGSIEVPEWAEAHWSPDGRFLAVETRPESGDPPASTVTLVFAVDPASGSIARLHLPDAIRPENLVAPQDRAARLQDASVRVTRWRGSTLEVESAGHGWIGPPGAPGSTSLTIRVRIGLEVSERGIRETSREVVTYARQ